MAIATEDPEQVLINLTNNSNMASSLLGMFSREDNLRYGVLPQTVIIIGLGGIGSWVARYVGSLKEVKNMILIDADTIELSNLNRTPYKLRDLNCFKTDAAALLVSETCPNKRIFPINALFNEDLLKVLSSKDFAKYLIYGDPYFSKTLHTYCVIDCRDNFFDDYKLFGQLNQMLSTKHKKGFASNYIVRGAYNGTSVTIDMFPESRAVFGDARGGYTIIPSHVIPSSLSALLCVIAAYKRNVFVQDQSGYTAKVKEEYQKYQTPLTFESFDIFDILYKGMMSDVPAPQVAPPVVETSENTVTANS